MRIMTHSLLSLAVFIAFAIATTAAVMCYECVWIKGRTDDDCFYMPDHVRKKYLVNCDDYEHEDGDDTVKFTHCETAIACLDRGFGKRQSLHRTCSVGPSGVSEENENTTMSPDMTTATSPGSSTDSPSAPSSKRRRKRASGSSAPTNNSTTENPAGPDPNSNDTMAEEAPPSATCSKLGDGETADGLTSVYNLTVCFCDTDECNVHASQTRLKNQIAYAASVCNDAQTFHHISPAIFYAILVWIFRSFTQSFKKETGTV